MNIQRILLIICILAPTFSVRAQTSQGAEIISYHTFGEGLMVTRAKMVPISGTVSNMFFYNRTDEPWNGNIWYEYDWELRGAHPANAWSQIRVREDNGGTLEDAPINVNMTENISEKILHYILIRQNHQYVYDVREDFDIATYDYTVAEAHEGNSISIIDGGPRIYLTGDDVADIPETKRLDFSLGITAFDINWSGSLPNGSYSGDYVIDFTRFYGYSNNTLNLTPQWQDEFNDSYLDYSKWFAANWTYQDTQFSTQNIRFDNGFMILRVNRDENTDNTSRTNLAINGQTGQSSTAYGGIASRAIDNNTDGTYRNDSVTHTKDDANAWWQVELAQTSDINRIIIYNRTDSCCTSRLANFSVSVLDEDNDVVWTQFYTEMPLSSLTIDLSSTGKTVKISQKGTLSLAEVEVFGAVSE